ncbi:MAG TPA: winged helix-turn-helix domain-containing protein [Terriglobia bacterium]|nr:winged helix-turn-helix domain-containing protein [Terriglobia bacterium]
MRDDGGHHSRRVRFYPFELDLNTGELCKHRRRIRLQPQPLLILRALLAKPGEVVTREDLRERIWPGNVFVDYEHSLNRSMNKVRRALGDTVAKPRYVETVHGRGYRFIAHIEESVSPQANRLAVLPVENLTGIPNNDSVADGITEALIDASRRAAGEDLRVIALATVLRYKNKRKRVAKIASELRADYLVCGRLRSDDGLFHLRVELVDASDRTSRWAASFHFEHGSLGLVEKDICSEIADGMELELARQEEPTLSRPFEAELQQAK